MIDPGECSMCESDLINKQKKAKLSNDLFASTQLILNWSSVWLKHLVLNYLVTLGEYEDNKLKLTQRCLSLTKTLIFV